MPWGGRKSEVKLEKKLAFPLVYMPLLFLFFSAMTTLASTTTNHLATCFSTNNSTMSRQDNHQPTTSI